MLTLLTFFACVRPPQEIEPDLADLIFDAVAGSLLSVPLEFVSAEAEVLAFTEDPVVLPQEFIAVETQGSSRTLVATPMAPGEAAVRLEVTEPGGTTTVYTLSIVVVGPTWAWNGVHAVDDELRGIRSDPSGRIWLFGRDRMPDLRYQPRVMRLDSMGEPEVDAFVDVGTQVLNGHDVRFTESGQGLALGWGDGEDIGLVGFDVDTAEVTVSYLWPLFRARGLATAGSEVLAFSNSEAARGALGQQLVPQQGIQGPVYKLAGGPDRTVYTTEAPDAEDHVSLVAVTRSGTTIWEEPLVVGPSSYLTTLDVRDDGTTFVCGGIDGWFEGIAYVLRRHAPDGTPLWSVAGEADVGDFCQHMVVTEDRIYTLNAEPRQDIGPRRAVVKAFDLDGNPVFERILPTEGVSSGQLAVGTDGLFVRGRSTDPETGDDVGDWIVRLDEDNGALL